MSIQLSEVISTIEGSLIGDTARGLPDPGLGLQLNTGMFLGRALREVGIFTHLGLSVFRTRTVNANESRNQADAVVNDAITVDFAFELNSDTDGLDQRPQRTAAYNLDTTIRGLVVGADISESRGYSIFFVETTERGALTPYPNGAGSFGFLIISSIYRVKRLESLTGGSPA